MRVSWSRLRPGARGRFVLGLLLTASVILAGGEAFLRCFPPQDFRPYVGEQSGLTGPYRPDPRFGVQYQSWDAFHAEYAARLALYEPLGEPESGRATWAMFGNSFVQAHGMLADTARQALPQRRIFNLARNEPLYVRLAQVELLHEHGFRPQRVLVAVMPLDAAILAEHALAQLHVTQAGAITYRPRDPGGALGRAIRASRLAELAWVRTGRHRAVPSGSVTASGRGIDPPVRADLAQLFGSLADTTRRHGVPVTVVLIPNHAQICRGAPCGFQDELGALCAELGLDVCDVRAPFIAADDKPGLFIPDKHFTPRGNRLLLDTILRHLHPRGAAPADSMAQGGPRP
jgi:hypothetical protein